MYKFPFQPVTMLGQFYFLTIPLWNILLPYLTPELLHLFPITRSIISWFPGYPDIIINSLGFHTEKYRGLDKLLLVHPTVNHPASNVAGLCSSRPSPCPPYIFNNADRVIFVKLILFLGFEPSNSSPLFTTSSPNPWNDPILLLYPASTLNIHHHVPSPYTHKHPIH